VGPARPEHIAGFREATGYAGHLFVDPSLGAFRAAGLLRGWDRTLHPMSVWRGLGALAGGFRQGPPQGDVIQQGGTFVLGPGALVRFEWRDRFAGDHPELGRVLEALPPAAGTPPVSC